MAKLLLSCDDYIFCYKGKYYARTQEKNDFYQRYLRVFDQLRLVTRCVNEDKLGKTRVLLDDERIEYIPLPFFSGPAQYAKKYFKIGRQLRNITDGCDAAILRLPATVAQRVGKKVMQSGIPYAMELVFDATDAYENATNLLERALWKMIDMQMKQLCDHSDGVSCVTERYMQQHYTSKKENAFFSHYSSITLYNSFFSAPRKYPSKKIFKIAHVCTQVQFNGRKGYNEIIDALKILKGRGVKVEVNFAGPDYHNGIALLTEYATKQGVGDMVNFVGGVTREQLSSYLEDSDLYVMPTWAEGLPRVIIEAMAKGLPCITTPVSGNPELVSKHFLVEYHDVEKLADRMEELITNKELYEATSKENFERSKKYEASVLEKRRDEFYTQLKSRVS